MLSASTQNVAQQLLKRLQDGEFELFLPYGDEDILNFIVQPTPHFLNDGERMRVYRERLKKKNWQEKWPCLKIFI